MPVKPPSAVKQAVPADAETAEKVAFYALAACVIAQLLSVIVTWPLWQLREQMPHLPVWNALPPVAFGGLMLFSAGTALIHPRYGSRFHAVVLFAACLWDQMRTQPQFYCLACLMLAASQRELRGLGRWFLASMWLWAGLHKAFSPDWFGDQAWILASLLPFKPTGSYLLFAVLVAAYEILLGLLAIIRPRWAILLCLVLHVGISLYLSPLIANWNAAVIPWNLCLAAVGPWFLNNTASTPAANVWGTRLQRGLATFFILFPAGYYVGWVDHYYAFSLYSDNLPRGLISTPNGCRNIEEWGICQTPFPHERRLIRQYFDRVAQSGWKLHIRDPRPVLGDAYFRKLPTGETAAISEEEFLSEKQDAVKGVLRDRRRDVFLLAVAGAKLMKRGENEMVYAVEIPQQHYRPEMLKWLSGLPNLEQLQLRDCPVRDDDLQRLPIFRDLTGIGLEGTLVTDAAVKLLQKQPKLKMIEAERTKINSAAVHKMENQ
jgi:hypothetical protein